MSSESAASVGPTLTRRYFCYQCNRTVLIAPSSSSELICPSCNEGFLEETENPIPNPPPNPFSFSSSSSSSSDTVFPFSGLPFLFSAADRWPDRPTDPDAFNPFLFLQNYLQTLISGGSNIEFVLDNHPSDAGPGAFRLPANLGDYFIGPGLEQLVQQLAENDPNRYGTPPAAKAAIEALPDIQVSGEELDSDSAQCAVCKDEFELGAVAKWMPCRHIYHPDCILPWLELHNSCPVCRYELPTDDPDYENRMRGTGAPTDLAPVALSGSGSGEASSEGNSPGVRTGESRVRISFPWRFNAFGLPAETSNSGSGGDGNNNQAEANENRGNSRDQENGDFGSGTRQEGLD